MKKSGFTLIEMLVVMCIIGILSAALLAGYGHVTRAAQRAKAQETVSNVATALNIMLQSKGIWPSGYSNCLKTKGGKDGNGMGCVEDVAKLFADYGLMAVNRVNGNLKGADRYGIVDPWAASVLRQNPSANANTSVPQGGVVRDHVIYFAVDDNLDGIVEAKVCGEEVRVRASAIAWAAGANGKLGSYKKRDKESSDNVYSWRRNQEVMK